MCAYNASVYSVTDIYIYIYIHHTYIYSINADGFIRIGQDKSQPCDPVASLREGRIM